MKTSRDDTQSKNGVAHQSVTEIPSDIPDIESISDASDQSQQPEEPPCDQNGSHDTRSSSPKSSDLTRVSKDKSKNDKTRSNITLISSRNFNKPTRSSAAKAEKDGNKTSGSDNHQSITASKSVTRGGTRQGAQSDKQSRGKTLDTLEIQLLNEEIDKHLVSINELTSKLEDRDSRIEKLEDEVQRHVESKEMLKAGVKTCKEQLDQAQIAHQGCLVDIENLKITLKNHEYDIEQLKKENKSHVRDLDDYERELRQREEDLKGLEELNSTQASHLEKYNAVLTERDEALDQLRAWASSLEHYKGLLLQRDYEVIQLEDTRKDLLQKNQKIENTLRERDVQLDQLQTSQLALVDRHQPCVDSDLKADFGKLQDAIKSFAYDSFIKNPSVLEQTFSNFTLTEQIEDRDWNKYGKHLIESSIWNLVLRYVFNNPFTIFGQWYIEVQSIWFRLFAKNIDPENYPQTQESIPIAWASQQSEKWRSDMSAAIVRQFDQGDWRTQDSMDAERMAFLAHMTKMFQPLIDARKSFDKTKCEKIFDLAASFAKLIALQRYRVHLVEPRIGEPFQAADPRSREYMIEVDKRMDDIEFGIVAFAVSPCLRKFGDGHGTNLDRFMDLVPAKVHMVEAIADGN